MFGSDSAPHPKANKESANGCCGCFTAPIAVQALLELFGYFGQLPKLQDFISGNAQKIYGERLRLPKEEKTITFIKEPFTIPEFYGEDTTKVVPFMAGKKLEWNKRA
jgi:dihydroorotase